MIKRTSIIIISYKRKHRLLSLLDGLSSSAIPNIEILIVEQGENNETEISAFARKEKISLKYIYLPTPSMTHARNVGARAATGELLLFLDDDVMPRPGLIPGHIKNFADMQVAATCGRCLTLGQPVEAGKVNTGRISLFGVFSDGFSSTIKQKVDTVIGCNMCWRKNVFLELGGMDEQFTGNALREESDLSLRAKKVGYTIVFEPTAVIEHLREETGGARKTEGRIRWYFDFFSNETYFFLKHRPAVLLPIYLLMKTEWALRCMFGFGREVSVRSLMTPVLGVTDGVNKYKGLIQADSRLRGNDKRSI
jgi:GT2 family glycosyltransferase